MSGLIRKWVPCGSCENVLFQPFFFHVFVFVYGVFYFSLYMLLCHMLFIFGCHCRLGD